MLCTVLPTLGAVSSGETGYKVLRRHIVCVTALHAWRFGHKGRRCFAMYPCHVQGGGAFVGG